MGLVLLRQASCLQGSKSGISSIQAVRFSGHSFLLVLAGSIIYHVSDLQHELQIFSEGLVITQFIHMQVSLLSLFMLGKNHRAVQAFRILGLGEEACLLISPPAHSSSAFGDGLVLGKSLKMKAIGCIT